jgi:hypothetical protein
VVQVNLNQASHPQSFRAEPSRHPEAYRRVYTRIPSNHSGSSFDSVKRIPVGFREDVVYSRIPSDRPGTTYDSARRVLVYDPRESSQAENTGSEGPVAQAAVEQAQASLRVSLLSWQAGATSVMAGRSDGGISPGGGLDLLQG